LVIMYLGTKKVATEKTAILELSYQDLLLPYYGIGFVSYDTNDVFKIAEAVNVGPFRVLSSCFLLRKPVASFKSGRTLKMARYKNSFCKCITNCASTVIWILTEHLII
jgi:hypothetical protein